MANNAPAHFSLFHFDLLNNIGEEQRLRKPLIM